MAWYDTGTVNVTNGSVTVTGVGTNFIAGAQVGEGFYSSDDSLYEIQSIVSATSLRLADPYLGATQTGQTYKIIPTQSLVASLATQVSTLIADFQGVVDEAGEGKFNDGTAVSAGITFTLDQDTGIFRPAANQIGFTTAGVQRALLTSTGLNSTVIGATTPAAGSFTSVSSSALLSAGGGITVEDPSGSSASKPVTIIGKRSDTNNSQSFSGQLRLAGNRTDAAVVAGKHLGTIEFGGNHTNGSLTNLLYPASMAGVAEGTFTNSTTMPTALVFYTGSSGVNPDTPGVTAGTERMRIAADGLVTISEVDINGGNIDGTIIGQSVQSSGAFTSVRAGLGSLAAPSISFTSETNKGFYSPQANRIDVVTGGVSRGFFSANGLDNCAIGALAPANATFNNVTATGGIKLGGTGVANYLTDYEEGTWTPVITDNTNNATSSIAIATYTKVGNKVHVQGRIQLSSLGSVTGAVYLSGLPFNSKAISNNFGALTVGRATGISITAGSVVVGDLRVNLNYVILSLWDATTGNTNLQATELTNIGDLSFSMDYLSN